MRVISERGRLPALQEEFDVMIHVLVLHQGVVVQSIRDVVGPTWTETHTLPNRPRQCCRQRLKRLDRERS